MPTNIVKSEFPPLEQWEEMEIVEDIGTADEHADTFYRWNNYGIEVHEDGLCQAYVIIQTDEGEIPKMVSEGFSSPEAVIEFFKNTEGEKALTEGEGNAPEMEGEPVAEGEAEEVAEVEKEPVPEEKDDGKKDDKMDDKKDDEKKDVKKSDVAKVGEAPVQTADSAGEKIPHAGQNKTDAAEPEIPGEKKDTAVPTNPTSTNDGAFACSDTEVPEPLGEFPVIKSYAEMRAEWEESHREYNPPATFVPGRTQKTLQKTQCKEFNDRSRDYPVDEIDKDPTQRKAYKSSVTHPNPHPIGSVRKSVEFGAIPSWEDLKAGYDFVAPATTPVVKGGPAMIPSTDEQIPGRAGMGIDTNNPEAISTGEEGAAEAGIPPEAATDVAGAGEPPESEEELLAAVAEELGTDVETLASVLETEEGQAALANQDIEALKALVEQTAGPGEAATEPDVPATEEGAADEGEEPAVNSETADDGQKRISLQSEPEDTL